MISLRVFSDTVQGGQILRLDLSTAKADTAKTPRNNTTARLLRTGKTEITDSGKG